MEPCAGHHMFSEVIQQACYPSFARVCDLLIILAAVPVFLHFLLLAKPFAYYLCGMIYPDSENCRKDTSAKVAFHARATCRSRGSRTLNGVNSLSCYPRGLVTRGVHALAYPSSRIYVDGRGGAPVIVAFGLSKGYLNLLRRGRLRRYKPQQSCHGRNFYLS